MFPATPDDCRALVDATLRHAIAILERSKQA
jgi:hypothetical protein